MQHQGFCLWLERGRVAVCCARSGHEWRLRRLPPRSSSSRRRRPLLLWPRPPSEAEAEPKAENGEANEEAGAGEAVQQ